MSVVLVLACCLLFTSKSSSQIIFDKIIAKGLNINDQPTDLTSDSPIALWMQQSGAAVRVCQRVDSVESYDSGLSPTSAQVKVGRCRARLVKAAGKQQVCPGIQSCSPTISEVVSLRTSNGIKDVTNALECTCAPPPSACLRRPWLRVYFRGTKYERIIDVGKCTGKCGGKKCQPLSIKTVVIKTPNGRKTVEVIEKCGCEPPCYRVSYKKAYPIVSISRHGNETHTQVIDVGMCSGMSSCSGTVREKCLYWFNSNNKETSGKVCLIRSKSRRKGCYAQKTRMITLPTLPNKEVRVIDSCACS